MAWQDRLYGALAGADPEWARQFQAAKTAQLNNQIIRQKMQDETQNRELERRRTEGLSAWNQAYARVMNGDLAGAAPYLAKIGAAIPDGDVIKHDGKDPETNRHFLSITEPSGSVENIDLNHQNALQILKVARAPLEDPEEYGKTAMKGMADVEQANRNAPFVTMPNGNRYRMQTDLWGNRAYTIYDRAGNTLGTTEKPPENAEDVQKIRKGDIDIEKVQSEIDENLSTVAANKALGEQRREAAKLNKANAAKVNAPTKDDDIMSPQDMKAWLSNNGLVPGYRWSADENRYVKVPYTKEEVDSINAMAEEQGVKLHWQTDKEPGTKEGHLWNRKNYPGGRYSLSGASPSKRAAVPPSPAPPKPKPSPTNVIPAGFIPDPQGRTINGKPVFISKDGKRVWY